MIEPPGSSTRPLLFVGIGNPLRGDDGVGAEICRELQRQASAEAVDFIHVQQLNPELALELIGRKAVLFADASVNLPPGSRRFRRLRACRTSPAFTHQLDPEQLLGLARLCYGAKPLSWAIEFGAVQFVDMDRLSEAVVQSVDEFLRLDLPRLRRVATAIASRARPHLGRR